MLSGWHSPGVSCLRPVALLMSNDSRLSAPRHLATRAVLVLCVLDFIFMALLDQRVPLALWGGSVGHLGGAPSIRSFVAAGGIFDELLQYEPWRYLSAVFVHAGLDHLAFNMLALWSFGKAIEERFGAERLVITFVLTGIAGFVVSRVYYGPVSPPTAGASGALYGWIGVELGVLLSRRDARARELFLERLAFAVGFALLFSVNNAAHAGGAVLGSVFGYIFERSNMRARAGRGQRWFAVALMVASVASVLLSGLSVLLVRAS
jgi:membrane associated rhomboid family serine protease